MNHHPFSPSQLERRRLCPGSYRTEKGLADEKNKDSEEGTLLHLRVAEGKTHNLSIEQMDIIERCFILKEELAIEGILKIEHEVPLTITDDKKKIICYGTADMLHHFKEKIIVTDFKFGRNPVDLVHDNIQLAAYCLGAHQRYAHKSIEGVIYQPRINKLDCFSFTNFKAIQENIKKIIKDCTAKNAECIPSLAACQYCKAKGTVCKQSIELFKKIPSKHTIESLTNKDAAYHYQQWKLIKKIGEAIEKDLKRRITETGECAGYKFKKISKGYKFSEHPFDQGKDVLPLDDYLKMTMPSPATYKNKFIDILYKLKIEKGEKITKKECDEIYKKRFSNLLEHQGYKNQITK